MSLDRLRTRDLSFWSGKGAAYDPFSGTARTTLSRSGRQSTWDGKTNWNDLQFYKRQHDAGQHVANWDLISSSDMGGTFLSTKNDYYGSHPYVSLVSNFTALGVPYRYSGPLLVAATNVLGPTSSYWPTFSYTDQLNSMIGLGTTAIARTIPTHPAAGVAQFLGELREGLPSIPGRGLVGSKHRNSASRLSDEYLNLAFGLQPMISDIRKFGAAIKDSNKILDQLRRDSGRLVRRRYSFPDVLSDTEISRATGQYLNPSFHVSMYTTGGGTLIKRRKTKTRTWFSGAYTYHFDQGHDLWSRATKAEQEYNRLFGLRITPELLWELTPWSWLADWVGNYGDVMTNVSAFSRDGLVLRWGYLMQEVSIEDTYTWNGGLVNLGQVSVTERFTTTVKRRVRATPYGFGLDPDWKDFTVRQLAILGALGITRAS